MHLIGIAGPSCAGKGTLCSWLASRLPAAILPLDAYYLPLDHLTLEERAAKNFDEPASLDEALLVSHLEQLKRGEPVERPVYDFSRHTRSPEPVHLQPGGYLLIEGLFTLYWASVRRLLSAGIYITAPNDVCLVRRVGRDQKERGRTPESVVAQYGETVKPMRGVYVEPTAKHADLILDGSRPIGENGALALEFLVGRFGG